MLQRETEVEVRVQNVQIGKKIYPIYPILKSGSEEGK